MVVWILEAVNLLICISVVIVTQLESALKALDKVDSIIIFKEATCMLHKLYSVMLAT